MVELDRDTSSFWRADLEHSGDLIKRIRAFTPDRTTVACIACEAPGSISGPRVPHARGSYCGRTISPTLRHQP